MLGDERTAAERPLLGHATVADLAQQVTDDNRRWAFGGGTYKRRRPSCRPGGNERVYGGARRNRHDRHERHAVPEADYEQHDTGGGASKVGPQQPRQHECADAREREENRPSWERAKNRRLLGEEVVA